MATSDPNVSDSSARGADDEREIDLREYIGIILDGWRWIFLAAILGFLVALYFAWKAAPVYQATSLMRVEQGSNMAPQAIMAQQAQSTGGAARAVSAEAAVIGSRAIVGDAVDELYARVNAKPYYFPLVGEPVARFVTAFFGGIPNVPLFGSYAWGNEYATVTRIQLPEQVQSASFDLVALADQAYELRTKQGRRILQGSVGQTASGNDPGVGAIRIFVGALNANPGTRFNVSYATRPAAIGRLQSRLVIEEQPRGSGLLDLRFSALSPDEAERQLDAIMSAYLQQTVERQSEQAEKRLTFLQEQLPEIRERRDAAEARLRDYQTESGNLDLSAEAQSIFQRLTNLDQQIAQTELQRQELLQEYTEQAPQVQAANDKRASLVNQRQQLRSELKQLPEAESRLLELRREVEVNNELYTQLLNTSQGLEITKAGITGVSYIVDSAYAPQNKIAPDRTLWLFLGLIGGVVVAVLLLLTRALLRVTVDDPTEIESKYGLPVYATVPHSTWEHSTRQRKGKVQLLALHEPEDPAIESIRSLRTSLQFALMGEGLKFIAVTGPTPACGKSFVSSNIAALIAQAGDRVLLVDADMRRGELYKRLERAQTPGLSEVLSGKVTLAQAVQRSEVDHLDLLMTGERPPNPAELFLSPQFEKLRNELNDAYDYVLFDLPPVLNVTDANIVARYAAATFLVIRSEHSTGHEVEQAIGRLNRDNIKVSGAIFNGLRVTRLRYGYSKYGYQAYRY